LLFPLVFCFVFVCFFDNCFSEASKNRLEKVANYGAIIMPHQNFASIPPKLARKFFKIGGKIFKILYATSNTAHENNIVNWHSECTNSFDMFVFLLFFSLFFERG